MKNKSLVIGLNSNLKLKGTTFCNYSELKSNSPENYDKIFLYLPSELSDTQSELLEEFLSKERLGDFLYSRKDLYVIGSSSLSTNYKKLLNNIFDVQSYVKIENISKMSPVPINIPRDLESYIEKIKSGTHFIDDMNPFSRKGGPIILLGKMLTSVYGDLLVEVIPYLQTDAGYTNCFVLKFIDKAIDRYDKKVTAQEFGRIHFLPSIKNFSDEGYIISLLQKCIEDNNYTPPNEGIPSWMSHKYTTTNQKKISECIRKNDDLIEKATKENKDLEESLFNDMLDISILWEKGTPLENAVKKHFDKMGIILDKHTDNGREDLVLKINELYLVFEVKGSEKRILDMKGIRQLPDWMLDYELKSIPVKGVLIVNTALSEEPSLRVSPFSEEILSLAKKKNIALITTYTLFKWSEAILENKDLKEVFKNKLISTQGEIVYDLK